MESCPACGRNDFKSKSGFTLHVKSCKGAADLVRDEKPKKKRSKNTAKLETYRVFRRELLKIAERMYENVNNFLALAEMADAVGHDGFAEFCKYFADTRIRMHLESVVGYAELYTDENFKEDKKPKPWEK